MVENTTKTIKYRNTPQTVQYGWKCPSCGAVMAPWQATCVNCSGDYQITCNSPAVTWSTSGQTTAKSDQINVRSTAFPYTVTAYNNNTMQDKLKCNLNSMGIDV